MHKRRSGRHTSADIIAPSAHTDRGSLSTPTDFLVAYALNADDDDVMMIMVVIIIKYHSPHK